ncbi:MAG TPA: hypothetical protein VLF60_03430 [Candidatus Saccharimonadales bacterium]|nr:hypothetical protein [Candidatus Saccharimonadales bacterium]
MAERHPSHYSELVDDVVTKEGAHAQGIAITVIPSLMERTDGLGVFEEGAIFSGSEGRGPIEACITSVASPYAPPRIPREVFLNASETILGSRPVLPEGMADIPELPAHLIVWWRNKDWDDDGQAGILRLAEESSQTERDDFRVVIEKQVTRAASIVHQASGRKPLIQSSWGHATPEERSGEGKSRGGPSNKHGHLHVLDLDPTEQSIELRDDLLAREKLNHFGPWNALAHQALSTPTTRILGNIAHGALPNSSVTSEAFTDFHFGANGTSAYCDGYRLFFDQPIGFGEAFDCLTTIASSFEGFYQDVTMLHSDFYKHSADSEVRSITRNSLARRAADFGYTDLKQKN